MDETGQVPLEALSGLPAVLPVLVDVAGVIVEVPETEPLSLALLIGSGGAWLPEAESGSHLHDALCDPYSPVGDAEVWEAGARLACRLSGFSQSVEDHRMVVRLCAALAAQWHVAAPEIAACGIDPMTAPLCLSVPVLHRAFLANPDMKKEDREALRRRFEAPLPYEPCDFADAASAARRSRQTRRAVESLVSPDQLASARKAALERAKRAKS